jgi:TatD DNase family protein
MIIDTHTHLFAEEFDADRADMITRAKEAGVKHFLLPNIDTESLKALYKTAEDNPGVCHPMLGLHPTSVKENFKEELDTIRREIDKNRPIAIGEIGLDYYWDVTFKEQQKEAFTIQLLWAKELNLPVSMHTRSSFADALEIVESIGEVSGVFHCFSGNAEDALKAVKAGLYLGIGGVVTFKNGGLDIALKDIPLEALVLETDAPYLAPVPYRGKRNEPSYLTYVVNKLAGIKNTTPEEVAAVTSANAKRIFNLPA